MDPYPTPDLNHKVGAILGIQFETHTLQPNPNLPDLQHSWIPRMLNSDGYKADLGFQPWAVFSQNQQCTILLRSQFLHLQSGERFLSAQVVVLPQQVWKRFPADLDPQFPSLPLEFSQLGARLQFLPFAGSGKDGSGTFHLFAFPDFPLWDLQAQVPGVFGLRLYW